MMMGQTLLNYCKFYLVIIYMYSMTVISKLITFPFTLDFILAMYYNHNPYFYISFVDTHFVPRLL